MDKIQVANYRIEKEIGRGGMATVYLAIQESLERKVALKVMSPALAADPLFCKSFLREGKIIAQFNHPNIIVIYDIGVSNFNYYMAMEYVGGGSLSARIEKGLSPQTALTIMRQVGGALGYAHERGFIHRDVKPANILFRDDGTALLTDFGIAKSIGTAGELTQMGYMAGTPYYMSPEQATGKKADARSDLYSLGILFHEMLTGKKPYVADETIAVMNMHLNSPLPRLPARFAQFQPFLDRLIAKDPDDRFSSAAEMIRALEQAGTGATRIMPPPAKTRIMTPAAETRRYEKPRPAKAGRKGGRLAGAAVGLAVLLIAGAFYLMREPAVQPPSTQEETAPSRPSLSQAEKEKIARLLEAAEAHLAVGRLREPPGSNAYEAYRMVLDIDPANRRALNGMEEIKRIEAAQQ